MVKDQESNTLQSEVGKKGVKEDFDKFFNERLSPILEEEEIQAFPLKIWPVHNILQTQ